MADEERVLVSVLWVGLKELSCYTKAKPGYTKQYRQNQACLMPDGFDKLSIYFYIPCQMLYYYCSNLVNARIAKNFLQEMFFASIYVFAAVFLQYDPVFAPAFA